MIQIAVNPLPFEQTEAHLVEMIFYDEWEPFEESFVCKPFSSFVPKWEDIKNDLEPNLRGLLE